MFCGLFLVVVDLGSVGRVLVSWCFFVLLICLVLVSFLLYFVILVSLLLVV